MSRARCAAAALLAATMVAAALLAAAPAGAAYDPLGGGQTRLTLAKSFVALLHRSGVHLTAADGAKIAGRKVTIPVEAGKVEPIEERAIVEHAGTLVFAAGRHKLPLGSLQLKTTRRSAPYAAKLGGGQLKLATSARPRGIRAGFGSRFRVTRLRLTAKVATRLDKKLRLPGVFAAGQPLGAATTTVVPTSVAIAQTGTAELNLDAGFAAKLGSVFVAVNPIAPAEHPGAFTLPIGGGGALAPDGTSGLLKTEGALEFIQVGGGQFFARSLEPDLTDHVVAGESQLVLPAGPGANQTGAIFGLAGWTAAMEPPARTISVGGGQLTLEPGTAQAFNEAFAKPLDKDSVFSAGEIVGTVSFTAQAE